MIGILQTSATSSREIRLECPPPPTPAIDRHASLIQAIVDLGQERGTDPSQWFGLEMRVAYRLAKEDWALDIPLRRFAVRPAVEPILEMFSARFRQWALDDSSMRNLTCYLVGRTVTPRSGEMRILPDNSGSISRFPSANISAGWLTRLNDNYSVLENPLSASSYAYACVVLNHPFSDGNGRLGRALFQASLWHCVAGGLPILPLGPATYIRRDVLKRALIALGTEGDWTQFIDAMASILETALDLERNYGR